VLVKTALRARQPPAAVGQSLVLARPGVLTDVRERPSVIQLSVTLPSAGKTIRPLHAVHHRAHVPAEVAAVRVGVMPPSAASVRR